MPRLRLCNSLFGRSASFLPSCLPRRCRRNILQDETNRSVLVDAITLARELYIPIGNLLAIFFEYGVHVLHDYLLRRREGQGMISHAIGRGVLVKALTTMIGFGTLMISTERGLVGWTTPAIHESRTAAFLGLPADDALEVLSMVKLGRPRR